MFKSTSLINRWARTLGAVALVFTLAVVGLLDAQAQPAGKKKPNILVIFGDDIG